VCIDYEAFGTTLGSYYWSSSSLAGNPSSAWIVGFGNSYQYASSVNGSSKNYSYYARAVRGGR
jgi:hypothetical protein